MKRVVERDSILEQQGCEVRIKYRESALTLDLSYIGCLQDIHDLPPERVQDMIDVLNAALEELDKTSFNSTWGETNEC